MGVSEAFPPGDVGDYAIECLSDRDNAVLGKRIAPRR